MTVKEQQEWKIPPCISNWKNAKVMTPELIETLGGFLSLNVKHIVVFHTLHKHLIFRTPDLGHGISSFIALLPFFSPAHLCSMCLMSVRATPFLLTNVWLLMVGGCKQFTSMKTLPSWPRRSTLQIERYSTIIPDPYVYSELLHCLKYVPFNPYLNYILKC